jgi:hypothetical protein
MPAPKGNNYAEGNKGGRPPKFTPELIEQARGYIDSCVDEYVEGKLHAANVPSIAGLARWLNVSRETIYAWREENKEFSDICLDVLSEQEKRLASFGLAGVYNPTITKLMMSKHGYTEKTETDITSKGEKIAGINYIVPNDNNH